MAEQYPILEIGLDNIYSNTKKVMALCVHNGIKPVCVIKGCNGQVDVVNQMVKGGCGALGSSRLSQLAPICDRHPHIERWLLRLPMLSEVEELVQTIDVSLISENVVIDAIQDCAKKCDKPHAVVLMADLGDLREGLWDTEELKDLAVYVETELSHVYLKGIGVNLGCYGSIKPTEKNLSRLAQVAEKIEKAIGRPLEVVSGGGTTSLSLVLEGKMPKKINHLRIGEAILLSRDLIDFYGFSMENMKLDTFVLKAEIVEIQRKPSYPVGEKFMDGFGNKPEFEDKGMRMRAILAVGKKDFGDHEKLIPCEDSVTLVGSSSDHLIIDITDAPNDYQIGDIMAFHMYYQGMLYATMSEDVTQVYV